MTKASLNHPDDEALRALSIGQLTEVELSHVFAHLGDCPACCQRIDQLTIEDQLLARLQKDAASREKVLVSPDQRRSAVRALRHGHEARSGPRKRDPDTVPTSGIANASAEQTHRDAQSSSLPDELTRFLAPPERPDEIGRLGPYRILAVLGRGGMGVVFRAHDPALDRLVALKVMLPGTAAAPNARERFLREARAAAGLKHPHVVTTFQVSEDRGALFLAMEFLEGEPLDQRIRREGRLPLAEVLRIGRETALGLAAAHARGLVHRDIKPANLWLEGPTGQVKVLDFGLARAKADQAHLTHSGLIVGTPAYMAPEQAEGKPVDPRCDLFSLGCVLYEMSTGTLPFGGESTIAVLRALALHEPPPVGELRPEAPLELSALVARLLAKKPDDRFQSAGEVADALGRCLSELPRHGRVEALGDTQLLLAKPTSAAPEPVPGKRPKPEKRPFHGRRWLAPAAMILMLLIAFGLTEVTSVTNVCGTVLRRFSPEGPSVFLGNHPPETPSPLPATYTNDIGMEFVLVPRGKAWLGGGEGKLGDKEVEIKADFYLGKYEVTQEEWEKVMRANPSFFSLAGDGKQYVKDIPAAELKRFPVELVSWDDAQIFLRLLNLRDWHEGWVYRLPKEVEWEYACRGGPMADRQDSVFDYYFDRPVGQLHPQQANYATALNRTCKVGSYPPNQLGLCDMHGNVLEWCDDVVKSDDWKVRAFRGGCWDFSDNLCRAASRELHHPTMRGTRVGLRLARAQVALASVHVLQAGKVEASQDMPPPAKAPFNAEQARDHQEAWAKYLGVPVETTNSLGMRFRLIPPGEFTMGVTDAEEEAWAKSRSYVGQGLMAVPAHPVRLTRPFYLGEGEVRYREFLDLMKREPGDRPKNRNQEEDGALMAQCTWFDCIAFCNRLSEREGLTPAYQVAGQAVTVTPGATGYRLPTEAEWEFACRGGTTSLWHFGWTAQEAQAMFAESQVAAESYLRDRLPHPNPFGLFGMYAGSSEWCWDWYAPGYYRECAARGLVVDPRGPDTGQAHYPRGNVLVPRRGAPDAD